MKKIIFFLLIAIVIASIPLKLYTVDFSSPPHTDDFGYILGNDPKPLYPERFMRIEGINFNTSLSIYQEIESAGYLSNNMIRINHFDIYQ